MLWVSAPEGRPTDTIYANPFVADVNGTRHVLLGRQRRRDARAQGRDRRAGVALDVSKRGLNTAALMVGSDVIVTHSEENIGHQRDGHARRGAGGVEGHADRQGRAVDRARRAGRLRLAGLRRRAHLRGRQRRRAARVRRRRTASSCGRKKLGTIQKSSPVLADGKLYVGTENGKFYILRPRADGVEVLDEDEMPPAADGNPEPIIASPAVARGRVYLASMDATYAIGPKSRRRRRRRPAPPAPAASGAGPGALDPGDADRVIAEAGRRHRA